MEIGVHSPHRYYNCENAREDNFLYNMQGKISSDVGVYSSLSTETGSFLMFKCLQWFQCFNVRFTNVSKPALVSGDHTIQRPVTCSLLTRFNSKVRELGIQVNRFSVVDNYYPTLLSLISNTYYMIIAKCFRQLASKYQQVFHESFQFLVFSACAYSQTDAVMYVYFVFVDYR